MDAITFTCPSCSRTMRTTNLKLAGKRIKCPKCGEPCPIPALDDEAEVEAPPPQTKRTAPKRPPREAPAPPPLREEPPQRSRRRPPPRDDDWDEEDEAQEEIRDRKRARKPESKGLPVSPVICLAGAVYLILAVLTLVGVFGNPPKITVAPGGQNPAPFQPGPGPNQPNPFNQPNQPNQPNGGPQGKVKPKPTPPTGPEFAVQKLGVYKTTNVKWVTLKNDSSSVMWADTLKDKQGRRDGIIVQQYNVETRKFAQPVQIKTIPSFAGALVSPDGKQVVQPNATGGFLQHWSLSSREELPNLACSNNAPLMYSGRTGALEFARNGKFLAGAFKILDKKFKTMGYEYRIWDVDTNQTLCAVKHKTRTDAIALSPDGKTIAFGTSYESPTLDFGIEIWPQGDASGRKIVLGPGRYLPVAGLAFAKDGDSFFASVEGTVIQYDLATGAKKNELSPPQPLQKTFDVVISANGKVAAASRSPNHEIVVWDVASRAIAATLTGHTRPIRDLAISSDGRFVASCSEDKTIRIWELTRQ